MSDEVIDRDAALSAARAELVQDPETAPTLRELLDHLVEVRRQDSLENTELVNALSGF